jgi:hypothetical protein
MDLETVLFNKDNFKFTRVNQNHYIIEFTIDLRFSSVIFL